MATGIGNSKNWFDRGGEAYARFRPDYPPELARFLAGLSPSRTRAVDVGCGTGQLTSQLALYFHDVVGIDGSWSQLSNARAAERVRYLCARAETLPLQDQSVSLVTAAQAAHWFELPSFYAEVRRIGIEGATIALVSYGVPMLEAHLQQRFSRFYHDEIGPYWPPERRLVDTGYANLSFPFQERAAPKLTLEQYWDLNDLLGYVSTWSAVRRAREAGREALLRTFADDLAERWGDASKKERVSWPLHLRVGRVEKEQPARASG